MKKVNLIVIAAAVLLVVIFSSIQPKRENPSPPYNAASEVTLSGTVEETREFFCPISADQEMHLVLQTKTGPMLVHMAPGRFLRGQQIRFNANDTVRVVGSQIRYQGQDAILAREITRDSEVVILRDHDGRPAWVR